MVREVKIDSIESPFGFNETWQCAVSPEDVARALKEGNVLDAPWSVFGNTEHHSRRIAYFVLAGEWEPVEVIKGKCLNGNHRLAAAIYLGREEIEIQKALLK